ncbi:MAG: hypothetical protein HONBIEJF_01440 [Fimbriimonadaceae bacterium]|nr:hypothetical protein [Fimbriimonadaceae bacterium]
MLAALLMTALSAPASIVDRPPTAGKNAFYFPNREPLRPVPLMKLPITAFRPAGWLLEMLDRQRKGLAGELGKISIWLIKQDNAWLNPEGKGKYGWEEVPYWLRGYCRIGFVLNDPAMIEETKLWVEGAFKSVRPNGDFGPIVLKGKGNRDLWAQMLMLQILQAWHEHSGDKRVIELMTNYFRWQLTIPDEAFLQDYWENSRGGDNLASVYWLYNRTGDAFLLELATKIDRNTANWRQLGRLPNFHVVNIAECFRAPATYFQQSGNEADLRASYRNFEFIREKYGEVPGGMFGADENARPGHDDPHQATETCAFVEQILSNQVMTAITGDPLWVANTEDVAFNSMPAAFMPDQRALRYLTAPNMVVSDAANHHPGIDNPGPYLLMNPFSSRCCQHNHTSGWVNFLESTWMATQDNGLAALTFCEGTVTAKVADGKEVTITTTTHYPFDGAVVMEVGTASPVRFPLYVLVPLWAKGASIKVAGKAERCEPGKYLRIEREWSKGDRVEISLPFEPRVRVWDQMKDAVSVDCGPLTFSLRIEEEYRRVDGLKTAQHDSSWQPGVDQQPWPTFEILPKSDWNFGLVSGTKFKVSAKPWPKSNYPFTLADVPIELEAEGRQIPSWGIDENGLCAILPKSPVATDRPRQKLKLIPMGAARLRISSFPQVKPKPR